MISLMTYNIGPDSRDHILSIVEVINNKSPDILVLNETSWFNKERHTLKQLSTKLALPYFIFAESRKTINHVSLFSKFPLNKVSIASGFQNAGITAIVETELGDIFIAGVHLASNTEDTRLIEVEEIISKLRNYKNRIILGDLNSISPENSVKSSSSSKISEQSTRNDVIKKIINAGYLDAALISHREQICTVPITKDKNIVYFDLRLDYVFLSRSLAIRELEYDVIINNVTRLNSDHYPIIVNIH